LTCGQTNDTGEVIFAGLGWQTSAAWAAEKRRPREPPSRRIGVTPGLAPGAHKPRSVRSCSGRQTFAPARVECRPPRSPAAGRWALPRTKQTWPKGTGAVKNVTETRTATFLRGPYGRKGRTRPRTWMDQEARCRFPRRIHQLTAHSSSSLRVVACSMRVGAVGDRHGGTLAKFLEKRDLPRSANFGYGRIKCVPSQSGRATSSAQSTGNTSGKADSDDRRTLGRWSSALPPRGVPTPIPFHRRCPDNGRTAIVVKLTVY